VDSLTPIKNLTLKMISIRLTLKLISIRLTLKMINIKISSKSPLSNKIYNFNSETQHKIKQLPNTNQTNKSKSQNYYKITPSKNHHFTPIKIFMTQIHPIITPIQPIKIYHLKKYIKIYHLKNNTRIITTKNNIKTNIHLKITLI
jgi:hypothetical protein